MTLRRVHAYFEEDEHGVRLTRRGEAAADEDGGDPQNDAEDVEPLSG